MLKISDKDIDENNIRARRCGGISEDDLKVNSTPDDELVAGIGFSFELELLRKRVEVGDRWQQLIQAHLFFDHVITNILTDALVKPEAVNAKRMSFLQKLQLIESMGLLPVEVIRPIGVVNDMRNKIAHDLRFEITDKEERDLFNSIQKHIREIWHQRDSKNKKIKFHELLIVLLLHIEVVRQELAKERILRRKAEIRLKLAVEGYLNNK